MAGGVQIIAGTGAIMGMDFGATIDERLHEHSPEIGVTLEELVREKTPILTGALQESMSYDAYVDPGSDDLVFVYADDLEQIQEWNRVYVEYVEGGALGLPTYTNDPREMFQITADTDGEEAVALWALEYTQEALDLCEAGAGIPL